MPLNLNYQTRDVSTEDIYAGVFDPPLVFRVRGRAGDGWGQAGSELANSAGKDVDKAIDVIRILCVSVSDGSETIPLTTTDQVREFYGMIRSSVDDETLAAETFCQIAYNLIIDYMREKKAEPPASGRPSQPLNGKGRSKKERISETAKLS